MAISFGCNVMLASTMFFLVERNSGSKWRTSVTVAALVTGVAVPLHIHERPLGHDWRNPLVLRYVDWLITVPLQVVEFS